MAWARLDDKRALHRKFRRHGFATRGLDEAAITYCSHEETDGFVSDDALDDLAHHHGVTLKATLALARELTNGMDRWDRDDERGGWWVKGYLERNPSHAELEAARDRDRNRKRKRQGSGLDSDRKPNGIVTET